MEQTRLVNLPIIGRVQHGEKVNNKITEYGYFIVKTQDTYMQSYVDKFDKLFKGKQSIEIEFFNEEPLSKRYVRYNQSGEVCRCPENSGKATQKVKNGWQQIECKGLDCQYRQKNDAGKCACNRIGWLKFLIPSISTDRIFLMKITGQTSINKLSDYINLQKAQGKSIKGHYILFLKRIEQTNNLGQIFNNYVLDILKKEEFISNSIESKINENQEKVTTINNNDINNEDLGQRESSKPEITSKEIISNPEKNSKKKGKQRNQTCNSNNANKNTTNSVDKKKQEKVETTDNKIENQTTGKQQTPQNEFENYYMLDNTKREIIVNKDGIPKEYLIAESFNVKEELCDVVIKTEDENEILDCAEGTVFEIEPKVVSNKIFALKINMIDKKIKEKVA